MRHTDEHLYGKCPTCERARGEEAGYARGVADERARVVADLRMRASAGELSAVTERTLRVLADLYERGEHESEAT